MVEEGKVPGKGMIQVQRLFEQAPDAISFYCDMAQILEGPGEVTLQFYETIPSPPGPGGTITTVRSRLRATVFLNYKHARNIGKLLIEKTEAVK